MERERTEGFIEGFEAGQNDQRLAAKDQMYFDADATHGYDSFLPEVIGILRVDHVSFDMANDGSRSPERKVRVEFRGYSPEKSHLKLVMFGHSYGECLRKIREEIRI